ncbi:MAG TPA: RsmG family class I SAM-dependent methyltransferase [Acidimicrobiales bacterium]|nr:RsmG family class I SAM-dependent methyltransferase [Acidimicrobiales bacterium]
MSLPPGDGPDIPISEGPSGALLRVLEEARRLGFLGPGPVIDHIRRALHALPLLPEAAVAVLDLGSGGGLPGLPLALARPDSTWVLLDGSTRRGEFLTGAVRQLGLDRRVEVVTMRAEEAGRRPDLRQHFAVVVARSFGPPAVTAECAAPFLAVGGRLIVAEPPGGGIDRWPADGLTVLGLRPVLAVTEPSAFQVLEQATRCPERFPRRVGLPAKRPLF